MMIVLRWPIALLLIVNCYHIHLAKCGATQDGVETGFFTSDGYPNKITKINTVWEIKVKADKFIRIDLAVGSIGDYWLDNNYITISDSAGRLHNYAIESFTNHTFFTTSNEAVVNFFTHRTDNRGNVSVHGYPAGFICKYKAVPMNESGENIVVLNSSTEGLVQNEGYPDFYRLNRRQGWQINVDPGHFIKFDVKVASVTSNDFISVFDGPSTASKLCFRTSINNYETQCITASNSAFVLFSPSSSGIGAGYPHGFQLRFQQVSMDIVQPCTSTRQISTKPGAFGYITNDGYSTGHADSGSNCSWLITGAPSTKIGIFLMELAFDSAEISCWGKVKIYDGGSTTSDLLAEICEWDPNDPDSPNQLMTSSNKALIVFESQATPLLDKFYFLLKYWEESVEKPVCKEINQIVNKTSGKVTSIGYPDRYDIGQDCYWNITVQPGYFIKLSIAIGDILANEDDLCRRSDDFLELTWQNLKEAFAENATFCKEYYETSLLATSNSVLVHFHSDARRNAYSNSGTDALYGYPRGFALSFQQVHPDENVGPCREIRQMTLQNVDSVASITSEYFHSYYETNSDCKWIVTVPEGFIIKFEFEKVDLVDNNCGDHLSIYDGGDELASFAKKLDQFCGQCESPSTYHYATSEYYTTSNVGIIHLHSEGSSNAEEGINITRRTGYAGFHIKFTAVYPLSTACRQVNEILLTQNGSMSGLIQSDGYPTGFDQYSRCIWRITGPENSRFALNITLGVIEYEGYLAVFDGFTNPSCRTGYLFTYSGGSGFQNEVTSTLAMSTSNVVTIYFANQRRQTESIGYPKGFQIEYEAVMMYPNVAESESNIDLTSLWICLGILVTVIIIVVALYNSYPTISAYVRSRMNATAERLT